MVRCVGPEVSTNYNDVVLPRSLEPRDLPTVATFERDIALISFPDDPITDLEFYERKLARAIGDPRGTALVVEDAGAVIGWSWLVTRENSVTRELYGELRSLYVVPSRRRDGVAFTLMRACLDYCARHGVSRIVGRTSAGNASMQAIYRLHGFEPRHVVFEKTVTPIANADGAGSRPSERAHALNAGRKDDGRSGRRRRDSRRS